MSFHRESHASFVSLLVGKNDIGLAIGHCPHMFRALHLRKKCIFFFIFLEAFSRSVVIFIIFEGNINSDQKMSPTRISMNTEVLYQ